MAIVIGKRDKTLDKGALVRVPVPGKPGRYYKMTRAEALARGRLPAGAETKARPKSRNKSRRKSAARAASADRPAGDEV